MRDPFLFCAHHRDAYPAGNDRLGPVALLAGRPLGQDFGDIDGWNMYHGTTVPGFPSHPHRGFETVTYVRQGLVDHADSLGAAARFGRGDVQWLTTGAGVVHSEMFPLLDDSGPNTMEMFQIWLNLPRASKMVDPYFTMLWDGDIPRVAEPKVGVEITVIAGPLDGRVPPAPPPDSWASNPRADVAIWHVRLDAGGHWTMPSARSGTDRTVYVFEGDGLSIDGTQIPTATGAAVRSDSPTALEAVDGRVEALVLQGQPIAEPVARHGPFVLNDRAGLVQAVEDYQRTGFGGWPWPDADPIHGPDRGRFAHHVDGREESPPETAAP
jgi:redox-sensitive bicupin YhaK (pirin superfamily)